ncbi:hypothetical protein [Leeuwenhoekiella sp. LLG6367-2.1]|uniref:hypothetical protein n=1 Tax=Leeuwenhoekiella sp. LLG6367-2.1 TaxID=3160833 RepID=UPI00386E8FAD
MKLRASHIDINKAIALCTRNGISVTSVQVGKKFSVKVDDNGREVTYDQTVYAHQINSAIKKTWRYYAAKLLNKQTEDAS